MTVSTIVVAINASLLSVKNGAGDKSKDEQHPEVSSEVKTETQEAATSEVVDKPKQEVKDEPKDKPEPKASADTQPEIKEEPVSETKDKPRPEINDESKGKVEHEHKVNDDAKPEIKGELKSESKEQMKSETKDGTKPEGEAEPKVETAAEMPSSLTPEIVTRVHKLYEELGRAEVKAVQEWEEKQKEIPAARTEAEQKPKDVSE